MKKVLLLILFSMGFQFAISAQGIIDTVTIEVLDDTLSDLYYHQENFDQPTKLVFPNLTAVTGYVYFHQNANLVALDFPVLSYTGNYVYFDSNKSLEIINAPVLETVRDDLYISDNTSLITLNICNLSQILPYQDDYYYYDFGIMSIPSYYIANNTSLVDATPFCFSKGAPENLTLSNSTILENASPYTMVGILTADGNAATDNLTYYLPEGFDNPAYEIFKIVNDTLMAITTFDFEIQNEYEVTVGVHNSLGEQTAETFIINIEDVTNENIQVIEILADTLTSVYYHQENFSTPTQLVFPNLTYVSAYVYFNENVNLVGVDFPMLSYVGDYVNLTDNKVLEIINTPVIETIYNNLYITGNTSLQEINICNLSQILPVQNDFYDIDVNIPYYYIRENTSLVDTTPFCFSKGVPANLTLSNATIAENTTPNTVVGILTAEGNAVSDNLTYYLVDGFDNSAYEIFDVVNDTLMAITTFDFESQNEYEVTIGVYNSLGEQTEETFTINIEDVANENIQVIEILADTLSFIYYHQENFSQPTQLVFPNLTAVSDYIYFNENVNLVGLDFPILNYVGNYTYFDSNAALQTVNAPAIDTIHNYLYVSDNTSLVELNICNLSYILPYEEYFDPKFDYYYENNETYYYIENNQVLDFSSTCLENTIINFNEEDTLVQMARLMVGSFEANTDKPVSYFIIEDELELTENENFSIEANKLFLTKDIAAYNEDSYPINIGALRIDNDQNSSLSQRIELSIEVDLSSKKISNSNSINSTYPFLNQFVDFNNCDGTFIEVYDFGSYAFAVIENNGDINMYADFYDGVYCSRANCADLYGLSNANATWTCGTIVTPTCNDGIKNGDETDIDCGGTSCTDCDIFATYPFLSDIVDKTNCNGVNIEVFNYGSYTFAIIETKDGTNMYADFYDGVYCGRANCADLYGLSNANVTWACGTIATPTCSDGIKNGDETGIDCGGTNCTDCDIFATYPFLNDIVDRTSCKGVNIEVFDLGSYAFAIVETKDGTKMYTDFYDGVYCSRENCADLYGLSNANAIWSCEQFSNKKQVTKNNLSNIFSMKIYPNPTSDRIYLDLDNMRTAIANWKIVSPLGKTIIEGINLPSSKGINISACKSGLHFMMLTDESGKMYKQTFLVINN